MVARRSPEEALVHAVAEARRSSPAVLFLPALRGWWETAPPSLRATLGMLLDELPPELPLLLAATADCPAAELDDEALALFAGDHVRRGPGELCCCCSAPFASFEGRPGSIWAVRLEPQGDPGLRAAQAPGRLNPGSIQPA